MRKFARRNAQMDYTHTCIEKIYLNSKVTDFIAIFSRSVRFDGRSGGPGGSLSLDRSFFNQFKKQLHAR